MTEDSNDREAAEGGDEPVGDVIEESGTEAAGSETGEVSVAGDPEAVAASEPEVRVEDVDPEAEEEELPFVYRITSYGADYPVDGLVKRMSSGDIMVPDFQRQFLWPKARIDRFIESLLLGLPVPGIFLARQPDSNRLLVIDGQQRLRSLESFYKGLLRGREFKLGNGVQEQFVGCKYETLDEEDRRRLDDSIIHATVIRQEEPSDDQSSIYFVFERLNTGGTLLQPQEIRAAIFQGEFSGLLRDLNDYPAWREAFGGVSNRMKDQELILRFFAFYFGGDKYERPMKEFLNEFMGTNRKLDALSRDELEGVFTKTIDALAGAVEPRRLFRPAQSFNAAVFDAVMVGMASRLFDDTKPPEPDAAGIRTAYETLLEGDSFRDAFTQATADETNVETRMRLASEAFAAVQ